MNTQLRSELQRLLQAYFKDDFSINVINTLSGGSINNAYRIDASDKRSFFVKANNALLFPDMFEAEKKGLELLHSKSEVKIPEVLFSGIYEEESFLVLEFIKEGKGNNHSYQIFGRSLAALHRNSNSYFGLDHNNYIGSLQQSNIQHITWSEFFIQERLSPQLKLAYDDKKISNAFLRNSEKLYKKLNHLLPVEAPALLHGDLWSGNYMTTEDGSPCFFDPAVYYGHREVDIAMTRLFGGFPEIFYEAYNDELPFENDWRNRMDIYNLYPILVHVNLFGGTYVRQAESIIQRYT
ncbi:MAG: fructosamine kinase family protein [Bacteroidota bacterium]|nr:fructosamine kinase family protein [Bacteroidota bacterium]